MNAEECRNLQSLISKLDDNRLYYRTLKARLRDAHARFLVSRLVEVNAAAADDLSRQMLLTGGLAATRGARAMTRFQARVACMASVASADPEAACLKRIARRGDRVMQRYQAVMARVGDLHQGHHRQLLALERARFRIESLAGEAETRRSPDYVYPVPKIADLSNPERSHR